MSRHGGAPAEVMVGTLAVGPVTRTYCIGPALGPAAPLLVGLHGAGATGRGMAALGDLASRAAAAGFTAVFPDGVGRVWNDSRAETPVLRRRQGVDDVAFLTALVDHLTGLGMCRRGAVFLTGISNGALLAEHIARHALLPVAGLGLVAGPGTVASRQACPRPADRAVVLLFHGTADPLVPYQGGPIGFGRLGIRGDSGRGWARGPGRTSGPGAWSPAGGAPRGFAAPVEAVATDWVAANGLARRGIVERVDADLPVWRTTWQAAGHPPVVLHRIDGGGHTWPAGPQYLPVRIIGPVAHRLDATGIILEGFAGAV